MIVARAKTAVIAVGAIVTEAGVTATVVVVATVTVVTVVIGEAAATATATEIVVASDASVVTAMVKADPMRSLCRSKTSSTPSCVQTWATSAQVATEATTVADVVTGSSPTVIS